jgi:hypothetical protein
VRQQRQLHRIGLGQQQHRRHAGQPHQCEVALEPPQVVVLIQPHDQQRHVDVADQDLAAGGAPSVVDASAQLVSRLQPLDHAVRCRLLPAGQHPVADSRRLVVDSQLVEQARRRPAAPLVGAVVQQQMLTVHFQHPHRLRIRIGFEISELLRQCSGQADRMESFELVEIHHVVGLCLGAAPDTRDSVEARRAGAEPALTWGGAGAV